MRKGNGSKLWQRCQLQSSFMAKEFSDKMKSLFQWQKVMKWHEQPFEFSLRDFDPNRPTRYILCTLHDRCAVVSWEGLRDRWLKKAHFQTSWNSEKIWTLSNILSRFFFFLVFFYHKCKWIMFWPACPVVSLGFLLFGLVHALNQLLNMQEITLPMVLCTQNIFIAIKKFPAFLNAWYK